MKPTLISGLTHTARLLVTPELTMPSLGCHLPTFSSMPPVCATAFLEPLDERS
jgi:hypothetical protein